MVAKKREPKASKPRAPDAVALKRSICEQIADGIPLREICRQSGMPAWRTVYDWVGADEAFAAAIARAREMGHEAIAEETVEMVDAEPERGPDGKVDPGWVAHTKLRVEHRLKLLAKWSPKKYGDKMAIGGADDLGPVQTVTKEMTDAERAVRLSRAINDNPAALQALLAAIAKKGAAK